MAVAPANRFGVASRRSDRISCKSVVTADIAPPANERPMQSSATIVPRERRRWLFFGLRTLLILTTLMAMGMGWIVRERLCSKNEILLAEHLRRRGLTVVLAELHAAPRRADEPPSRWRGALGRLRGPRVVSVIGPSDQPPFADLAALSVLQHLRHLHLAQCTATNLAPLHELGCLQYLGISGSPINDLTPLAGLSELEELSLSGTQVRDVSPLAQLSKLRVLHLTGAPIADITPLARMEGLNELNIRETAVSADQVEALQKALPRCRIVR